MTRYNWLLRPALVAMLICFFASSSFGIDASMRAFSGLAGTLKIVGGTATVQLMKGAARRIMNFNPAINIAVAGGGSANGIQSVGEGLAQISNSGRPLLAEEIEKYGLQCIPFAVDWIAVAVHPRNPVSSLTLEDLKGIFSGKITNWKEVGGADAPISVLGRDDGSGARAVFEETVLGGDAAIGTQLDSNDAVRDEISQDIYAIGFFAVGAVDKSVKPLNLGGIPPVIEMIVNGKYPLVRRLYMNIKKNADKLTERFVSYIRSPAGAELIRRAGFIPCDSDGIQSRH